MRKRRKRTDLKRQMWLRLSALPETLDLDVRTNEEPEDIFVSLANDGRRNEVIAALRSLLVESLAGPNGLEFEGTVTFLRRAIRLCDSLGAEECKDALKLLLLHEGQAAKGGHVGELQTLAARVLSGLPKSEADFEFWSHMAHRLDEGLPYALNAAIDIDWKKGVGLLSETYFEARSRRCQALADWRGILQLVASDKGVDALADFLLDMTPGEPPEVYEHLLRLAGIQNLRRPAALGFADLIHYDVSGSRKETSSEIMEPEMGGYHIPRSKASAAVNIPLDVLYKKLASPGAQEMSTQSPSGFWAYSQERSNQKN